MALNELVRISDSDDEDPNVRSLAIWALGRLGP